MREQLRALGPAAPFGLAAVAASLVMAQLVSSPPSLRVAIVVTALVFSVPLAFRAPRVLLFTLVAWLAVLALVRRLVDLGAATTSKDLLLLVEPVALGLLVLVAAHRGAFRQRTLLANAVLVLSGLTLLGALNPAGAGHSAEAEALLFVFVPPLAFWVGRGLCDDRTLERVFLVLGGAALVVAVYGLGQALIGFPRWDAEWAQSSGFEALSVDEVTRPFSTFASPAEFGYYLAVGVVVWAGLGLRRWKLATLGVVAVLLAALAYESSRGVAVTLAIALGLMLAARRGLGLRRAVVAGALALVALTLVARATAPAARASGSALLAHQFEGLAHPLRAETSTIKGHGDLIVTGLKSVRSHPLGQGVAAITIAGSKAGAAAQGTEADPSNAAVALGLPGLVVYVVVFVAGLLLAYRTARRRRDALAVVALGVVAATALQWLNGGQYSVAILPWLVLGWLDRREAA